METRKLAGAVTLVVLLALVTVAILASGDAGRSKVPPGLAPATFQARGAPAGVLEAEVSRPSLALPPCVTYDGAEPHFIVCGPFFVKSAEPAAWELVARGRGVRDDCASPQVDWGDGEFRIVCLTPCSPSTAAGGGRAIKRRLEHTYHASGTYTVRFLLMNCGPEYRPQVSIVFDVHVEG